jgi:hypothetical protein
MKYWGIFLGISASGSNIFKQGIVIISCFSSRAVTVFAQNTSQLAIEQTH